MLNILIMAGGKGERFWPQSRARHPKQLLNLTGNGALIRETVRRVAAVAAPENIYIITGALYADPIRREVPEIPEVNLIIEPEGRNTAPCIGLAALAIGKKDPDGVMAVLASDHIIKDESGFCRLLEQGAAIAEKSGNVVTLGIKPDRLETGYGYIKIGTQMTGLTNVYQVDRFTEKPDLETAREFLKTGNYLWNSGMFIWKIATIRRLIAEFMPQLHQGLEVIGQVWGTVAGEAILRREFAKFEKISIDYGIMERAPRVAVLPADIGWDDVGSWTALERIRTRDSRGNIIAKPNTALVDVEDCIIETDGEKLIAAVGIRDLIYVETADAVLILPKDRAQDIKLILEKLRSEKKEKYL
ncbi:MAG: mannose-1-phosphate guanylyltransferase [Bacillota bacterium]